ncbi:MAG: (d)CMP kinase [Defluviitaleaceae bacterium]|nr:(d)CMP kinase [Defluviitaleaceae bacterium]
MKCENKFHESICAEGMSKSVKINFMNPFVPKACQKTRIIAIDGRAASGKSTVAARLASETGAGVVHMDDFFLPPDLRTPQRLNEPGGNIHYERFAEEVLPFLHDAQKSDGFSYRIFDCEKQKLTGIRQVKLCKNSRLIIVEGSYSCHPIFGNYADIRVFCTVEPEIQKHRIINRNGKTAADVFVNKWIPLEENYFNFYKILQDSDIVLK